MAYWQFFLVIFLFEAEATPKIVDPIEVWILPRNPNASGISALVGLKSCPGIRKQKTKRGVAENKIEILYSDFLRTGITDRVLASSVVEAVMRELQIFYKLEKEAKYHKVTRKQFGTKNVGRTCTGKRISIIYVEDVEVENIQDGLRVPSAAASSFSSANAETRKILTDRHIILSIGLEVIFGKIFNASSNDPKISNFGKQAARDNMKLFLISICNLPDVICVANTNSALGSLYFAHVLGGKYTSIKDLNDINPMALININEHAKPAGEDANIAWVHVDSRDISSYLDYWALFSELRVHVEKLIFLMSRENNISEMASEFNSQKKIHLQYLQPPGIYITMEYIENLTIDDFEIGSRALGSGIYGDIRLGRCLETRQEVAIKIENDISSNNPKREKLLARRKKAFTKEIRAFSLLNNQVPGILRTFGSGSRKFSSNRFDYVNDLFHPESGDGTRVIANENKIMGAPIELIGIVVERLHVNVVKICEEGVHISPENIRKVMVQMFDSVFNLHSKNLVHRDIKSLNFMIDLTTNEIKLLDLGFAKQYNPSNLKIPKKFKGTYNYASYDQLMKLPYKKGDDMEAVAITFYDLVCKKQATNLNLEQQKYKNKRRANAIQKSRNMAFQALGTSELEVTIRQFYSVVWNYNHPKNQDQPDVASAQEENIVCEDPNRLQALYEELRLILTGGAKDFNSELQWGWLPSAAYSPENIQMIHPEQDMILKPIKSALESPLQQIVFQKFNANFPKGVQEPVGIFISLDILMNSVLPTYTFAKLNAKTIIPVSPPKETDIFLASICSFFPCILIANYDMGEAHVLYRFNLFAHYFLDILHKKHLTKNLSNLPMDIKNRISGNTKSVLIHGKDLAVASSSSGGATIQSVTYTENQTTDDLVTRVYNAIKT